MEGGRLGQVLGGRYVVGRLLGCGGMADVYRARDRVTGTEVAVKIFRPGLDLADTRRRARHEFDVLRSLRHDGLVCVVDARIDGASEFGHDAYLVVELVAGPTLQQVLRDGPLPDDQAAALGAALCAALGYLHQRGVVHRDVKPANVLLATPNDPDDLGPKLTDFGLAAVVDSTLPMSEGQIHGTANYLSPEQVTGEGAGPASDIFALGLVLIEAVTGAVVYPGLGVQAAVARLHRPPTVPVTIGSAFADLLLRMTAGDPAHRPSAAAAGAELTAIAGLSLDNDIFAFDAGSEAGSGAADDAGVIGAAGPAGTPRPVPGLHRRRRTARARLRFGLLAGAAAVVAGVMTAGAVLFGGDGARAGAHAQAPLRAASGSTGPGSAASSSSGSGPSGSGPSGSGSSGSGSSGSGSSASGSRPGGAGSSGPATSSRVRNGVANAPVPGTSRQQNLSTTAANTGVAGPSRSGSAGPPSPTSPTSAPPTSSPPTSTRTPAPGHQAAHRKHRIHRKRRVARHHPTPPAGAVS